MRDHERWHDLPETLEKWWGERSHQRDTLRRTLNEMYKQGYILLDVGCGVGFDYPAINNMGYLYNGIDVTREMIERAQEKYPQVPFHTMDAYNIEYDNDYFDVVFCHDVIIHVPEPKGIIEELVRVAKRHVILKVSYITDKETYKTQDDAGLYNVYYNADDVINMLIDAGALNVDAIHVENYEKCAPDHSNPQIFVARVGDGEDVL